MVRVHSASTHRFPKPVTFESDTKPPKARRDFYAFGFPGEPRIRLFGGTPPVGHETTQVISTVFGRIVPPPTT